MLVSLALVGTTLGLDLPRASQGEFWGDGATYYAMAWSLARDLDLRFDAGDLARVRAEYPSGPQGLFLKRASGGLTVDAAAGFPWVRRVRPDEGRLYYAKAFAHPLVVGSARGRPRHARPPAGERPPALGARCGSRSSSCGGGGSARGRRWPRPWRSCSSP